MQNLQYKLNEMKLNFKQSLNESWIYNSCRLLFDEDTVYFLMKSLVYLALICVEL